MTYNSDRVKTQTASERVRMRLEEERKARGYSQRDLAELLTRHSQTNEVWTQSKVAKVLGGKVQLTVDDADAIAAELKVYLSEAVRDRGLEFYAEMTPMELRVLDGLRKSWRTWNAVLIMLALVNPPEPPNTRIEKMPAKRKRGRPRHSEQELTN